MANEPLSLGVVNSVQQRVAPFMAFASLVPER